MLTLDKTEQQDANRDTLIQKMKEASMRQHEQFGLLFGLGQDTQAENSETEREQVPSSCLIKEDCTGEEVISTREELSMELNPFHSNLLTSHQIYD